MELIIATLVISLCAIGVVLWRVRRKAAAEEFDFQMPEVKEEAQAIPEPVVEDEIVVEHAKRNVFELSSDDKNAVFTRATIQEEAATISGFDAGEDQIVIEVEDPTSVDVVAQLVTEDGLLLTLSNDLTVTLPELNAKIPTSAIIFVAPGMGEAA